MATTTTIPVKIRQNVVKLAKWDPLLEWYGKAVEEMQKRPLKDPTSWRYQAAIHGFDLRYPQWQKWVENQTMPAKKEQQTYWEKCQHGTWFFLPWHRMYLGIFEDIVRSVIADLKGPSNWALPYWNYSADAASRSLPQAFTDKSAPFAAKNPLYEPTRSYDANGRLILQAYAIEIDKTLRTPLFENGNQLGFGGPDTQGPSHIAMANTFGALEAQPHNAVHGNIGGIMGDPTTAGFDPIFWLHHANIDRLWEVWLKRDAAHQNPANASWLTREPFAFRDQNRKAITRKANQVLNTLAPILNYRYDDISDPLPVQQAPRPSAPTRLTTTMARPAIAEVVGATKDPIALASVAKTVDVPIMEPTGPALLAARGGISHRKVFLHVENITGVGSPCDYGVYLNLPEASQPKHLEQHYVGNISMFGLKQASRKDKHGGGSGLHYAFDITELAELPQSKKVLESGKYTVTFEPRTKVGNDSKVSVGQISVHYQ